MVETAKYDWANDTITDQRFSIKEHALVKRALEYVEFDHDSTSEEILAEFVRLGLTRPTHEDALQFGVEHKEEQRKRRIVFLHEPVQGPFGHRRVLVLDGSDDRRHLDLDAFGYGWFRYDVFAGVREPQQ